MIRGAVLALTIINVASVLGALYQGPTQQVLNSTYDYIIVGAGAGGAVMASRLSEDPRVRVLLVEAGGSDFENLNISVPGRASALPRSEFDWNFTTTAQVGLDNRPIVYPRGFVLGDQMAFCRGTVDDYARWANVTGDDGWSWEKLLPFIFKVDRMTAPADRHNPIGQFDPTFHKNGILPISVEGFPLDISPRFMNTTQELAGQFPFNLDYNSGDTIGFGWVQSTIHDGRRVTSATSYLAQAFGRKNLDIMVNTHITKVFPIGIEDGKPVFRGVQFAQTADGPLYSLKATKEVILSAGSLKTPHILMLSGIGDVTDLKPMGIKRIVDLPAVGKNLHDHAFLGNSWLANSNNTLDNLHRNNTLAAEALALWQINGTGPLVLGGSSQFGWLRIPQATDFFQSFGISDPSPGLTSAHFELLAINNFISKTVALPTEGHFFSIITVVISPTARGNVTLNSTNPFDAPIINPNLLGSPVDLAIMREAVKAARAFVTAPTHWN